MASRVILIFSILSGAALTALMQNPLWILLGALTGGILSQSPRVAKQWERAVVLGHGPRERRCCALLDGS